MRQARWKSIIDKCFPDGKSISSSQHFGLELPFIYSSSSMSFILANNERNIDRNTKTSTNWRVSFLVVCESNVINEGARRLTQCIQNHRPKFGASSSARLFSYGHSEWQGGKSGLLDFWSPKVQWSPEKSSEVYGSPDKSIEVYWSLRKSKEVQRNTQGYLSCLQTLLHFIQEKRAEPKQLIKKDCCCLCDLFA